MIQEVFLSEDAIVEDIVSKMSTDSRKTWLEVARDELIQGHHTTGRSIRNSYSLWREHNPHVDNRNPLGQNHADQMSMRIMEKVWDKVHNDEKVSQ